MKLITPPNEGQSWTIGGTFCWALEGGFIFGYWSTMLCFFLFSFLPKVGVYVDRFFGGGDGLRFKHGPNKGTGPWLGTFVFIFQEKIFQPSKKYHPFPFSREKKLCLCGIASCFFSCLLFWGQYFWLPIDVLLTLTLTFLCLIFLDGVCVCVNVCLPFGYWIKTLEKNHGKETPSWVLFFVPNPLPAPPPCTRDDHPSVDDELPRHAAGAERPPRRPRWPREPVAGIRRFPYFCRTIRFTSSHWSFPPPAFFYRFQVSK